MRTFDQNLVELYLDGRVTLADATYMATSPHELRLMITQRVGAREAPDEREFERLLNQRGPLG